nr:hypothetical protein Iba_chr08eCG12170 [Ipomoea batatas]
MLLYSTLWNFRYTKGAVKMMIMHFSGLILIRASSRPDPYLGGAPRMATHACNLGFCSHGVVGLLLARVASRSEPQILGPRYNFALHDRGGDDDYSFLWENTILDFWAWSHPHPYFGRANSDFAAMVAAAVEEYKTISGGGISKSCDVLSPFCYVSLEFIDLITTPAHIWPYLGLAGNEQMAFESHVQLTAPPSRATAVFAAMAVLHSLLPIPIFFHRSEPPFSISRV